MHLYQLILIIVLGILLYNIFDISPENEKKPIKSDDSPQIKNTKIAPPPHPSAIQANELNAKLRAPGSG